MKAAGHPLGGMNKLQVARINWTMVAVGSAARMITPITATPDAPAARHARTLLSSVIPPSAMIGTGLRRAL
jgi:hypothetical protein